MTIPIGAPESNFIRDNFSFIRAYVQIDQEKNPNKRLGKSIRDACYFFIRPLEKRDMEWWEMKYKVCNRMILNDPEWQKVFSFIFVQMQKFAEKLKL